MMTPQWANQHSSICFMTWGHTNHHSGIAPSVCIQKLFTQLLLIILSRSAADTIVGLILQLVIHDMAHHGSIPVTEIVLCASFLEHAYQCIIRDYPQYNPYSTVWVTLELVDSIWNKYYYADWKQRYVLRSAIFWLFSTLQDAKGYHVMDHMGFLFVDGLRRFGLILFYLWLYTHHGNYTLYIISWSSLPVYNTWLSSVQSNGVTLELVDSIWNKYYYADWKRYVLRSAILWLFSTCNNGQRSLKQAFANNRSILSVIFSYLDHLIWCKL